MVHAPARRVARVPLESRFVGAGDVVEIDGELERTEEGRETASGNRSTAGEVARSLERGERRTSGT
jgi:hypothetical protein